MTEVLYLTIAAWERVVSPALREFRPFSLVALAALVAALAASLIIRARRR